MFDKNVNIIKSEVKYGKTTFLEMFSKSLMESGYKVCYIGTSRDKHINYKDSFNFHRIITSVFDEDYKIISLISEIIVRDKYDYLFIDDIEYFYSYKYYSKLEIDKLIENIDNIPVKKIITCDIGDFPSLPTYSITSNKFFNNSEEHIFENYLIDGIEPTQIIKSYIRDIKIENILK